MLLKKEAFTSERDQLFEIPAKLQINSTCPDDQKICQAQSFCHLVAKTYWISVKEVTGVKWPLRRLKSKTDYLLDLEQKDFAIELGKKLKGISPEIAGYAISLLYQENLPKSYREKHGIYYTPKCVVDRMLDVAEELGVDFLKANILDPSSGGAAYLAPLCRRMIGRSKIRNQILISDISSRLIGIEIDPFAAWLSQFLVDCVLAEYANTSSPPPCIIKNISAFDIPKEYFGKFDYVIGNPPYGIVKNIPESKNDFSDVVSGKINLYQLFLKLGLDLVKEGGVLHYLTPTGFLSGSYFRCLRRWMELNSNPVRFEFFEDRKTIFKGVQQEIVISMFKKENVKSRPDCIQLIKHDENFVSGYKTKAVNCRDGLWILPKSEKEAKAALHHNKSKETIISLGFTVKTGCLVPHRNKNLISSKKIGRCFPIVWSEAIHENKLNIDRPYLCNKEKWYKHKNGYGVLTDQSILVKRTSSKEQKKRISVACVPKSILRQYGGYIAENHVNVIQKSKKSDLTLSSLSKFISSDTFEELFKCCSGTVTVSATELKQIPMPSYEGMILFQNIVGNSKSADLINSAAEMAYEV